MKNLVIKLFAGLIIFGVAVLLLSEQSQFNSVKKEEDPCFYMENRILGYKKSEIKSCPGGEMTKTFYSFDGKVSKQEFYKNDKLINVSKYNENGELIK